MSQTFTFRIGSDLATSIDEAECLMLATGVPVDVHVRVNGRKLVTLPRCTDIVAAWCATAAWYDNYPSAVDHWSGDVRRETFSPRFAASLRANLRAALASCPG